MIRVLRTITLTGRSMRVALLPQRRNEVPLVCAPAVGLGRSQTQAANRIDAIAQCGARYVLARYV